MFKIPAWAPLLTFVWMLWFFSNMSYSWNAEGHKIVAQIAYDNMTSDAKQRCNDLIQVMNDHSNFVNAAVWLDKQRSARMRWLKPMHYIDIPFSTDGTKLRRPNPVNAVAAIEKSLIVLQSTDATPNEKALHLRIILHVVADLHQPLHAVNRFSRRHPAGDKGGNLFFLKKTPVARNLHAYWDKGGGLLETCTRRARSRNLCLFSAHMYRARAYVLERKYPCSLEDKEVHPRSWANESLDLAVNHSYTLRAGQKPPQTYQDLVQELSQQRLAQAGCRLASLLNRI